MTQRHHASHAIDRWFDELLDRGGSDLHLSVGYPPMGRVKGELVALGAGALTPEELDPMLFELLDEVQLLDFERTGDLDFALSYGERARFRANYLVKTSGNAAVFRTIPTEILTAEQLRLPPAILDRVVDRAEGLVLVTGPTGSGKSTTLASLLDHVNRTRAGHILTIEDPIEFVHRPMRCQVTHKEVGVHVPTFADAIRSAIREDVDVVLVGELRGAETMKLALTLASAGIQVFATVHTNSAGGTIDRYINVFPAEEQQQVRSMLADSLAGVIAQQLLRTADGSGRVAAHEILVGSPAVASIIREGRTSMIPSLIQGGKGDGMQTMDVALQRLVEDGIVSAQDALEKAGDKEAFERIPAVSVALGQGTG